MDKISQTYYRWPCDGVLRTPERAQNGVNVLPTKQVAKSIMGFHALSDRVLILKMAKKHSTLLSSKYTHLQAKAQMKILNSSTMIWIAHIRELEVRTCLSSWET